MCGARAGALDTKAVNDAHWSRSGTTPENRIDPSIIKAQVLLDRAHFSPGEIDGKLGSNFKKALTLFSAENCDRQMRSVVFEGL